MGTVHQFPPIPAQTDTETGAGRKKARMEDGYTGLANELIEELMKAEYRLSGREYCILLAVVRKTFGYKKSADWIALSQFTELTGIGKTHVHLVIKGLVARNMLIRSTNGNDQKLAINTVIGNWLKENPLKAEQTRKRKGRKQPQKVVENTVTGLCKDITGYGNKSDVSGNKHAVSGNHKRKRNKPNINTLVDDADASSTQTVDKTPDLPVQQKQTAKAPAKRQASYRFEDCDRRFAQTMLDDINRITPITVTANLNAWANDIRLLREALVKNGQDARLIAKVWQFANTDAFWQSNVKSAKKFRQQFSTLYLRAQSRHLENRHENRTTGAGHSGAADPHTQFFGNVGRESFTDEDYDTVL
ncbi:replication protein [Kistimonas scapharcae]|uniref:Replication protein n=1 Tax=Kistimonas scapharcae TaxID=1036133 RepID=A0ABP8VBH7_9GAMM